MPAPSSPFSFTLAAFSVFIITLEVALVAYDYLFIGYLRVGTARLIGIAGVLLFIVSNLKSVALALARVADDALTQFLDIVMRPLWRLHFWFAPLAVISLGLFLLVTPLPQPPFYYVAYGVLLWQAAAGFLAREALPVPGGRASFGRIARAAHRQPAVFILITVLVVAGFVDSAFP